MVSLVLKSVEINITFYFISTQLMYSKLYHWNLLIIHTVCAHQTTSFTFIMTKYKLAQSTHASLDNGHRVFYVKR